MPVWACVLTHDTVRGPRHCCPGSRCRHRTSSAPGCSDYSYRQTLRPGTEEAARKMGWLGDDKKRQNSIMAGKQKKCRVKNWQLQRFTQWATFCGMFSTGIERDFRHFCMVFFVLWLL